MSYLFGSQARSAVKGDGLEFGAIPVRCLEKIYFRIARMFTGQSANPTGGTPAEPVIARETPWAGLVSSAPQAPFSSGGKRVHLRSETTGKARVTIQARQTPRKSPAAFRGQRQAWFRQHWRTLATESPAHPKNRHGLAGKANGEKAGPWSRDISPGKPLEPVTLSSEAS
jgi:hypothetical protein